MAVIDQLLQFPNTTTLLSIVGIFLALFIIFPRFDRQRKEPPGPRPLPLFGNLLHLKTPHKALHELSKTYGTVFKVHFGPQKMVVLAGYKTIRKALVNHSAFSERNVSPIVNDLNLTHGIIFANGDSWREMRNFALMNLKDFGMGRKESENKIIEECQHLIDVIKAKDGKAFDTIKPLSHAVCNIICSIVYGTRFEYDDAVFISMVARARKNTELLGSPLIQLYNLFPRLFGWFQARKELMKGAFVNRREMKELIQRLQDTLNPQSCRGLVDSFLVQKKKHETSGVMNSHYHEDNLLVTVVNMFTAGTETSSTTIKYGLLLMAKYSEIQDKVQEELSRVVGCRQILAQDRKNLPYTDAVIHEIQRVASVVPVLSHQTSRDVTFQGYFIKKATPVLVLLSSSLHDEEEWEKPHTFHPAHFLDKEGNFRKRDAFLPFSAGARACIGESLAQMEIFLFFTSLLQHFRFVPPLGVTKDDLDMTLVGGFALAPSPQELIAISRV
ncbi:cytochrome P450 2K1-like [Antennarius striatus]|uniref:cytochrome P450 2K1-like n=1 Tax=Antennarius striatus TaxID=241820 RepID=UPI0035AD935D